MLLDLSQPAFIDSFHRSGLLSVLTWGTTGKLLSGGVNKQLEVVFEENYISIWFLIISGQSL